MYNDGGVGGRSWYHGVSEIKKHPVSLPAMIATVQDDAVFVPKIIMRSVDGVGSDSDSVGAADGCIGGDGSSFLVQSASWIEASRGHVPAMRRCTSRSRVVWI